MQKLSILSLLFAMVIIPFRASTIKDPHLAVRTFWFNMLVFMFFYMAGFYIIFPLFPAEGLE